MDFETAKSQLMSFSQTISSDTDRYNFFQWLGKEVLPEFENQIGGPKDRVRRLLLSFQKVYARVPIVENF